MSSKNQDLIDDAEFRITKASDALAALEEALEITPGGKTGELREATARFDNLMCRLSRRI